MRARAHSPIVLPALLALAGLLPPGCTPSKPTAPELPAVTVFQPEARDMKLGADQYGASLLRGDIARMATLRIKHRYYVGPVVYSPDGKTLATGSEGACYLMDAATGRLQATRELYGFVEFVAFSPDGKGILLGDCQRRLHLHETATGKSLRGFGRESDTDSVNAPAAFSPDGKQLITSGRHGIHLLDALADNEIYKRDHEGVVTVDFSPDGRFVASGSCKSSIRLWEATTGNLVHEFEGHPDGVSSVRFSPDSTMMASGGGDRLVRLWDLRAKKEIREFVGHQGPVRVIALSPDGRMLVSGSEDETIRLWEMLTGKVLLKIERQSAQALAFSPDGTALAAALSPSTVVVWDVATLLKGRK